MEERNITHMVHTDLRRMFSQGRSVQAENYNKKHNDRFIILYDQMGPLVGDVTLAMRKGVVRCFFDLKMSINFKIGYFVFSGDQPTPTPGQPVQAKGGIVPVGEGSVIVPELDQDSVFPVGGNAPPTYTVNVAGCKAINREIPAGPPGQPQPKLISNEILLEVIKADIGHQVKYQLALFFQAVYKAFNVGGDKITMPTMNAQQQQVAAAAAAAASAMPSSPADSTPKPIKVEPAAPRDVTTAATAGAGTVKREIIPSQPAPAANPGLRDDGAPSLFQPVNYEEESTGYLDSFLKAPIGTKIGIIVAIFAFFFFFFQKPPQQD